MLILDGKAVAAEGAGRGQGRRRRARASRRGVQPTLAVDPGRRRSRLPGLRAQQEARGRRGRHRLARLPLSRRAARRRSCSRPSRAINARSRRSTASCSSSRCPRAWTRTRRSRRIAPEQGRRRPPPDEPRQAARRQARRWCRARRPAASRSSTTTASPLEGAEAVVVGRSRLVGKPLAQLLLGAPRHRDDVPHAHARPRRALPARRHPLRGGRPAALGHRRHGEARARSSSTSASTASTRASWPATWTSRP